MTELVKVERLESGGGTKGSAGKLDPSTNCKCGGGGAGSEQKLMSPPAMEVLHALSPTLPIDRLGPPNQHPGW